MKKDPVFISVFVLVFAFVFVYLFVFVVLHSDLSNSCHLASPLGVNKRAKLGKGGASKIFFLLTQILSKLLALFEFFPAFPTSNEQTATVGDQQRLSKGLYLFSDALASLALMVVTG